MVQQTETLDIDCKGMQCPAPILELSKAWRSKKGSPTLLTVVATDSDFPRDLKAWARTTKTDILELREEDGVITATLALHGAQAPTPVSEPEPEPAGEVISIDCEGMQCPAPILELSKAWRAAGGEPTLLRVTATDCDFPRDLKAWARTTKTEILELTEGDVSEALLGLNGATLPTPEPAAPAPQAAPTPAAPQAAAAAAPAEVGQLDLRDQPPHMAMLQLGQAALTQGGLVRFVATSGPFEGSLYGWAAATQAQVRSLSVEKGQVSGEVFLPGIEAMPAPAPAPTPVAESAPTPVQVEAAAPVTADPAQATGTAMVPVDSVPREDLCTLLVLHNDLESLLAAMMVANTSAAQGMEVNVYFSFWGVNLLRADSPRSIDPEEKPSLMQSMMKMMMPKGPDRQSLAKMNMGGMGSAMMKYLMRQRNILSLREMMAAAAEQDVKFVMCTMSMGLMGIDKRDIMELENLEWGGVTSFVEASRRSAVSLVF